jgi:hypothetical protein
VRLFDRVLAEQRQTQALGQNTSQRRLTRAGQPIRPSDGRHRLLTGTQFGVAGGPEFQRDDVLGVQRFAFLGEGDELAFAHAGAG